MSISFNISTMFSVKAKADFSSFPGGSHWWPLGIAGATGIFRAANECILGTQFGGLKIIPARDPKQCGGVEG